MIQELFTSVFQKKLIYYLGFTYIKYLPTFYINYELIHTFSFGY